MRPESHLSEQELLLIADGESPSSGATPLRAHIKNCVDCRERLRELETTMAEFAQANRQELDPCLPSATVSRARLKSRLDDLASHSAFHSWRRFFAFTSFAHAVVGLGVAALFAVLVFQLVPRTLGGARAGALSSADGRGVVPDRGLTPGVTRSVALSDVCAMPHEQVVREVPAPVRDEVLREYRIVNARADDYEIDYLIAPGLGGAGDIRNLWPEPQGSAIWNASVKDALEERLHQLVCARQLDLSTAQKDISTDWIAAYKKYFHTDRPLAGPSNVAELWDGGVEVGQRRDAPPTIRTVRR